MQLQYNLKLLIFADKYFMRIKSFTLNPFGVNCYLYYDENTGEGFLIDPAVSDYDEEKEVSDFVTGYRINIRFIINTHGHIDHVMGNKWASGYFSAPVLIHEDDNALLSKVVEQGMMFGIPLEPLPGADKFISAGELITIRDCSVKILHTPGHSPGGICIVDEANKVIFSGDLLFNKSIGRTDLPGGDMQILLKSINEKILCYPDDFKIYPGHMDPTTIGDERINNPFLNGEIES